MYQYFFSVVIISVGFLGTLAAVEIDSGDDLRQEILKRMDTDGDGVISAAEREQAKELDRKELDARLETDEATTETKAALNNTGKAAGENTVDDEASAVIIVDDIHEADAANEAKVIEADGEKASVKKRDLLSAPLTPLPESEKAVPVTAPARESSELIDDPLSVLEESLPLNDASDTETSTEADKRQSEMTSRPHGPVRKKTVERRR